ncbi:MAG: hypothetical protein JWL59_2235 [Chthoniobacteraceae bacterium]|nr:hypothetical protein [Chthoniobacteraceae bacterium]
MPPSPTSPKHSSASTSRSGDRTVSANEGVRVNASFPRKGLSLGSPWDPLPCWDPLLWSAFRESVCPWCFLLECFPRKCLSLAFFWSAFRESVCPLLSRSGIRSCRESVCPLCLGIEKVSVPCFPAGIEKVSVPGAFRESVCPLLSRWDPPRKCLSLVPLPHAAIPIVEPTIMKSNYLLAFLIAPLFLCFDSATAQTGTKEPPELAALQARYETDMAAALQPVQNRFISGLQNLLKTYTQRGDLPSAIAVQAQLDNLTNALGKPIPVGSPQSRLAGTSWDNPGGSRLEFLPSGHFREVYPQKTWKGTWKAISATEADAVVAGVDSTFHYKLNNDTKTVSRPDSKSIWKLVK